MDLNQLKTFVTVADEKHLTRAAERLLTSQPAVSAQLKVLEDSLGVRLFNRSPKGMILTPQGEKLLQNAKATLAAADNILSEAKSRQGSTSGKLKMGTNSDFEFLKPPKLMSLFSADYPGIVIRFEHSSSAEIIPDIRRAKLDSGFFFGPCGSSDLQVIELAQIKTAIVAPIAWRDRIKGIWPEELAKLPWIYTTEECPFYVLKEAIFSNTCVTPNKVTFVDNEDSIRALIKSEYGISILRESDAIEAEENGWGVRWEGETMTIPLSIAVQKNRIREPLIQAWIQEAALTWALSLEGIAFEETVFEETNFEKVGQSFDSKAS